MGRTAYISLYIRIVCVLCIRCVILLHNTMSVNTYSMLSSTLLFLAVGDAVHIGLFQASSDASYTSATWEWTFRQTHEIALIT